MKATIISVVSLLVGFLVGCGVGYRYNERYTTNEAIREMVDSEETSEAALASISTCAIASIDSGEPQKAVELLSSRVAHYYCVYGMRPTNEQRIKLRALIDGLASTNQTVAAQIAAAQKRVR